MALCLLAAGCLAVPESESGSSAVDEAAHDPCGLPGWTDDWMAARSASRTACDGDACGPRPIGPDVFAATTTNPVLVVHGFNSSPRSPYGVNPAIVEALAADAWLGGAPAEDWVRAGELPPYDGVPARARVLVQEIDRLLAETGADRVNIIGHSMAGLDARYAVGTLGYGDRIASITMIAAPNHGSTIVDAALALLPQELDGFLDGLLAWWTSDQANPAWAPNLRAGLESLATPGVEALNRANPDDPRVCYQSFAGVSDLSVDEAADACEGLLLSNPGTEDALDWRLWMLPNLAAGDGVVPVDSARWGHFRGCLPADHFDLIGQVGDVGPDSETGFDARRFWRATVDDLARRGL
jgi:triacylglycerol lipase